MPRAPEVEFFVAPFLLSFLPFFAGKSAIFIAKSDRAGKQQADEEVERRGSAAWGKFPVNTVVDVSTDIRPHMYV